jgi:hypothetical protein
MIFAIGNSIENTVQQVQVFTYMTFEPVDLRSGISSVTLVHADLKATTNALKQSDAMALSSPTFELIPSTGASQLSRLQHNRATGASRPQAEPATPSGLSREGPGYPAAT